VEIIKHALGSAVAHVLTLFARVYDLDAALRLGVVGKAVAADRLIAEAIDRARSVHPDCHVAYAFAKRALQATTMAAIDAAAQLDRSALARGMTDPSSLRAHTRRYRE